MKWDTTGQYAVLRHLWSADGMAQHELGHVLQTCEPTISLALRRLEVMRFVRREKNPANRRERLVFVTEDGRRLRPILASIARDINAAAIKGLSEKQADELKLLLWRVIGNLDVGL
ncbi:MarR family transcriptional regulator [Sphingopyxis sp.]|uniref:MarR family winged helix-turn-helix transcriptional regulator n=1 Tax=Sphingopyxis sp. TaxID=1908224 RepID=UPI0025DCB71A|nr:MarR family transcriptional regulator [Sphingopyxis sp.]